MIDNPRVRLTLAAHGRRIAVGAAIVGAALLVVAIWLVMAPGVEATTEIQDRQEIETELHTSAVVVEADAPWAEGTELENRPAYLLNATPNLDVTAETTAPPGSTVVHDLRLRTTVERDDEIVWERTRQLASEETTAEDGVASTAASIDLREYHDEVATRQREFAGVGTVESTIVLDTRYDTGVHEGTVQATPSLVVTDRAYWLDGDRSASTVDDNEVVVEEPAPVDWMTVLILVALGGCSVAAAAGAATYRVEADVEGLRQELHRQRYDDWISDGSLPMGVGSEYVALDSLKDVVDVAIDTNQRVVCDRRRNVFAAISGDVVYYYSKEGDWNQVAWPTAGQGNDDGPSFAEAFGLADEDEPGPPPTPSQALGAETDTESTPFGDGQDADEEPSFGDATGSSGDDPDESGADDGGPPVGDPDG